MPYPKNYQKKVLSLLDKDQENIYLYKKGENGLEKMKKESDNISHQFVEIINDAGFPFLNIAPENVYKAAITLSLHLPISGLKHMFNKIKNPETGMIKPAHTAYFIDKILIHSGKKQKYGTQYKINREGTVTILPIENYSFVGARRRELGLETLAEYKSKIIP